MERQLSASGIGIDLVTGARRYDYGLSTATPLDPNSNLYRQERPLEIDVHEGTEVGILLTGRQERHFEDLVVPIVPGDVWLSATWEPHGWEVTAPNTRDVVLIFLPEFLGEERLGDLSWLSLFAVPASQRPRVTGQEMREKVRALGYEVLHEMQEQRPGWQSAIRLDVLRLLLTLSREWKPPARPEVHPHVHASNLPRIMAALVLVHSRPARRVTLADAAEACGLSRAQFCLIFRNTMGMTFGRFCMHSRLGVAAQLLVSTDLATQAIAAQTGFADGSHLHRAFVKHYRCTPGLYRAQAQHQQLVSPGRVRGSSYAPPEMQSR